MDVTLILSAIRCGVYSQDYDSAKMSVALLLRVSEAFAAIKSKSHHTIISQWFTKINPLPLGDNMSLKSVLRGTSEMLDTHPSLVSEISKLIYSIF